MNGAWGEWKEWSECSTTCGLGTMKRQRECKNPEPHFEGDFCPGEGEESVECKDEECPSELRADHHKYLALSGSVSVFIMSVKLKPLTSGAHYPERPSALYP